MTAAVCIACGTLKLGALAPCPACGFRPDSSEDQARSIVASDHHLGTADLKAVGQRIQRDEPIDWPADVVDQYVARIDAGGVRRTKFVLITAAIVLVFVGLIVPSMTLVLP